MDPKVARRIDREYKELDALLRPFFPDDKARARWWDRDNPAFGGETPYDLIVDGDTEQLRAMIHQLEGGIAT